MRPCDFHDSLQCWQEKPLVAVLEAVHHAATLRQVETDRQAASDDVVYQGLLGRSLLENKVIVTTESMNVGIKTSSSFSVILILPLLLLQSGIKGRWMRKLFHDALSGAECETEDRFNTTTKSGCNAGSLATARSVCVIWSRLPDSN